MHCDERAEHCIEQVIGCGCFQVVFYLVCVLAIHVTCAFNVTFMAFGIYNPGWRCLDNSSAHSDLNNTMPSDENGSLRYEVGCCQAFQACGRVEFNPESITVVTQWALICDRAWVVPTIISLQMVGMFVGSLVSGQMADWFGRKTILYTCLALDAGLQILSYFSVSWLMFTIVRFFMGVCTISLLVNGYLFVSEVMTKEWRAAVFALPDFQLGAFLMAVASTILKDWRHMEIVGCVLCVAAFIPVAWVPESIRWLEVNDKKKEFKSTVTKMAHLNKKTVTETDITLDCRSRLTADGHVKRYTWLDLFHVGYRFKTVAVTFLLFTYVMIYYALMFGVNAQHGDFYTNLMVLNSMQMPFSLISSLTIRFLKRKTNTLIYLISFSAIVFTIAGVMFVPSYSAKSTTSTVLVPFAQGSINGAWYVLAVTITEMYPSVVRGLSLGWASAVSRLGGVLCPLIIPDNKDSYFLYMIAIGVVALICCVVHLRLPETKGEPLKTYFDDHESENENDSEYMNIGHTQQLHAKDTYMSMESTQQPRQTSEDLNIEHIQ